MALPERCAVPPTAVRPDPTAAAAAARAAASPPAVRARGLAKTYGDGTRALAGVDLDVAQGEIFCLLGPNGAGKTTLVRILGTQLEASGGEAALLGFDLARERRQIRRRLAAVPQQCWPDQQLRVFEHICYYLLARGMRRAAARAAAAAVIERLGLAEKSDRDISTLSGGMQRRVLLAMALASGAELLLLDEPTAGLDVLLRREVWRFLGELRRERTILLTTHSMEEAEALSDRLGILAGGELVAVGTAAELRRRAPGRQKVVIEEGSLPRETAERFGHLQEYANKWAVFPRDEEALRHLLDLALAARVEASLLHATLEDVFVYLVGEAGARLKLGELR